MSRPAALRIATALADAAKGGYYRNGWYAYMDKRDIEALALAQLEPTEAAMYWKVVEEALAE